MLAFRKNRFIDSDINRPSFTRAGGFDVPKLVARTSINTILQQLHDERGNQQYNHAWEVATAEWHQKKDEIQRFNGNMKRIPDECHIAIIVYTLEEPPIYRDFNARCRSLTSSNWSSFPYKSLYGLLVHCVGGVRSSPVPNGKIYRGVKIKFNENIDHSGVYNYNDFTSWSEKRDVAREFSSEAGTLKCFMPTPMVAIGIAKYSMYDEEEVLVFPWSTFNIIEFDTRKTPTAVTLKTAGNRVSGLPYTTSSEPEIFQYSSKL